MPDETKPAGVEPDAPPVVQQVEMTEDGDGLNVTFTVSADGGDAQPIRIHVPAKMAKRLGRHMRLAARKMLGEQVPGA